jgi:hypothetical protein
MDREASRTNIKKTYGEPRDQSIITILSSVVNLIVGGRGG